MSANNEILIEKTKSGYVVSEIDVESCSGFCLRDEPFKTLEEAIEAAQKYQGENVIEYGIRFKLNQ